MYTTCSLDSCVHSRIGYMWFSCKKCSASCGVSTHTTYGSSWHISSCSLADTPCPSAERQHHQDLPSEAELTCVCCSGVDREFATCSAGHQLCNACFDNAVSSSVKVNSKSDFLKSGCKVYCSYCLPSRVPYDMQICGRFLTQDIYGKYMQLLSEYEFGKKEQELQERLRKSTQELEIYKSSDPVAARRNALVREIADECILPRCPDENCLALTDTNFDGCCVLKCLNCSQHYCCWCFTIFATESEAHLHVPSCVFNPPCNR